MSAKKKLTLVPQFTPESIIDSIMDTPAVKNDDELLYRLANAKRLLPEMSQPQFERIVTDELAGTIATIIGRLCFNKSNVPVVMVTSPKYKNTNVRLLKKVVKLLREQDFLPRDPGYDVTVKMRRDKFFCMRRFENAQANGVEMPDRYASLLTLSGVPSSDAKKLFVQNCSKSCSHYEECAYQILLAQMQGCERYIMVYDEQQYRSAQLSNKLPKSRAVVMTAPGKRIVSNESKHMLTEAELKKLLSLCEVECGKFKSHKRIVFSNTDTARKKADRLFAMVVEGYDEAEAKTLLKDIIHCLNAIYDTRRSFFRKNEDDKIVAQLHRMIKKMKVLADADIDVTHKNQGKRALIAA